MKYSLIATDMDGTLIDDYGNISSLNKEAIIKVQEKGVKFVLASGRPTFAMVEQAKELQMDKFGGYIISYNGGEIIDCKTSQVVYTNGLTKEEIIDMYNYANENNIYFVTYNKEYIYANKINELTKIEAEITGGKIVQIEDIEKLDFSQTIKCMLLADEETLKEHEEKLLNSKFSEKMFFVRSLSVFLEVINKDVNKGKTLEKLLGILNIDNKEVISVGDSYNDMNLLEISGLKTCPSNSKPEIKAMCDYIGCSNNEGILNDVITKYILK